MIEKIKEIKFIDILAIVVIVLCFTYFILKGIDNGMVALSSLVVSYYYGSSAGKDKPPVVK